MVAATQALTQCKGKKNKKDKKSKRNNNTVGEIYVEQCGN